MSWKDKFSDEVTSTSFSLTLSKNMVRAMALAAAYQTGDRALCIATVFSHSKVGMQALINKGLVEHTPYVNLNNKTGIERDWDQEKHIWYKFTPAGTHLYELLILSGLINRIEKSQEISAVA